MELSVFERLILLNILPAQGDFTTLKQCRLAREELAFTDEENTKLKWQRLWVCRDEENCGNEQWLPQEEQPSDSCQCGGKWRLTTRVRWDIEEAEKIGGKVIEFNNSMVEVIRRLLKELNSNKKLSMEHYSLYAKFMDEEP